MTRWNLFSGSGIPLNGPRLGDAWRDLPEPPPWRRATGTVPDFETTPELLEAVNAALHLRRPLLLTGQPGSGKSTLVELIAAEFQLGDVLRWHITSKSTLEDGLYRFDALSRLQAIEAIKSTGQNRPAAPEDFVTLGPLGTALASTTKPRAVLIDEIDKSDLDLPSDLLNVLERGTFDISQLLREASGQTVAVRGVDYEKYDVAGGRVTMTHPPVVVMTSNGERVFPAPFLRRCIRYTIPAAKVELLTRIVSRHLGEPTAQREHALITTFAARLAQGETLAIDQLLNLVHMVTGERLDRAERERLENLLLQTLSGT